MFKIVIYTKFSHLLPNPNTPKASSRDDGPAHHCPERILRPFLLLAGLLLALQASAYPRLTGDQWLKLATMPAGAKNNLDLDARKYMDVQMADAYLDAVHDMTQGREVCIGRINPDEVSADVYHAMRELPAARLKEGAADLLAEILRKLFPCTERRQK